MFTDVLEQLYAKTGDKKYLDFGLRLYRECPNLKAFFENPAIKHADGTTRFNGCFRAVMAPPSPNPCACRFGSGLRRAIEQYRRLGRASFRPWIAGSCPAAPWSAMELVNSPPRPWNVGYEYCTIFEREFTLAQRRPEIWRCRRTPMRPSISGSTPPRVRATPDGTAVLYCSPENRLSVNDEIGRRQRFSPTHQQVAVCCNPNATRVAAYYIANSWMRPNGAEPAIAAMLYGPSEVTTDIAGTAVAIEEKTLYPYSGDVELTVRPAKPVAFCLWLRNPSWSNDTRGRLPRRGNPPRGRLLAGAQAMEGGRQADDPFRPDHPRGARHQRRSRAPIWPVALCFAGAGNGQDRQDLRQARL